ncbi:hypothetical protein KR018_003197 [Drosophila ironensis]|nr:hypothetical protein KR018_003197 [Drosophila ironensis]
MEKIVWIYYGYALLIGMTSYRLVDGRFRQSRTTQAYALVINILTICLLPIVFQKVVEHSMRLPWFPKKMSIVPAVLYSVNYAVIVYILATRCYRDSLIVDLLNLTDKITRKLQEAGKQTNPKLRRLFFWKSFTLTYLCIASVVSMGIFRPIVPSAMLINIGYSILNVTTFFYFVSFWQIARGFDFVNNQLEDKNSIETVQELWAIHLKLNRMACRINRIYGLQMLISRIDYITFTTIYSYVGIIYFHDGNSWLKMFLICVYFVRGIDFFLNDYIAELIDQRQPKNSVTEGPLSKEVLPRSFNILFILLSIII